MTEKTLVALVDALDAHLGEDDTANTLIVERQKGPAVGIIRADMLEVLKTKAAAFDAQDGGDEEDGEDAFTILGRDG